MALTRLREDCDLREDGRWTGWIRAMIPALGEEDQYFIRRADGQVGYRYIYILEAICKIMRHIMEYMNGKL